MFLRRVTLLFKPLSKTASQTRFIYTSSNTFFQQEQQAGNPSWKGKKAAVILSGCGYLDGTDVAEAALLNVQLSRLGLESKFYAPSKEIEESMNYLTKAPDRREERYPDKEAARIVRKMVYNVSDLPNESHVFDVLFIPGGAGAIRNLSTFDLEKYNLEYSIVDKSVASTIQLFYRDRKPIGTMSQAGILVASVLGKTNKGPGVQVTIGRAEKEQIEVVNKLGNKAVDNVQVLLDKENNIVSASGHLGSSNVDPYDLYKNIIEFVEETLGLIKN
jgi:enhancing lycopene biosynthesis protein 2